MTRVIYFSGGKLRHIGYCRELTPDEIRHGALVAMDEPAQADDGLAGLRRLAARPAIYVVAYLTSPAARATIAASEQEAREAAILDQSEPAVMVHNGGPRAERLPGWQPVMQEHEFSNTFCDFF